MSTAQPDVSVIIIVHNDPVNLVASVESAKSQTADGLEIVVVDDCSDDDSYQVALQLATTDSRIRVLQTHHNTGGPGAPRNLGIRASSAPWITFVDSDDVLEPEAVEIMLRAALEDDAELVCGQTRRLHLAEGRWAGWRTSAYQERAHLSSIDERLDLATDTMAPAKLYRRTFLEQNLLSFDEYMHFEDLVFTAAVYAYARSISIVPDYVYVWKVYPTDVRRSITHQRHDEQNLEYRLEATDRIEQIVNRRGHEKLRDRLRLKFLEHDARLYLSDFADMPLEQAQRVLCRLEGRLRQIPERTYALLPIRKRLMYGMALTDSALGVLELLKWSRQTETLAGRTVIDAGRMLWRPTDGTFEVPVRGSLEYRLLDITDDPILGTPFHKTRYGHRATEVDRMDGGGVIVKGVTSDPLRKIVDALDEASATAVFTLKDAEGSFTCPVNLSVHGEGQLSWKFSPVVPAGLPFVRPMRFGVRLEIRSEGSLNTAPVLFAAEGGSSVSVASTGPLRSLLRQRFVFYRTESGRLGLKLIQTRGRRGRIEGWIMSMSERLRLLRRQGGR